MEICLRFIIDKLNKEFCNLFSQYINRKKKLLKDEYKGNNNNLNEIIIYKDYNYHRMSLN